MEVFGDKATEVISQLSLTHNEASKKDVSSASCVHHIVYLCRYHFGNLGGDMM